MILDKEEHRTALIGLIKSVQIPGASIEEAYELLKAIQNATVQEVQDKNLKHTQE